MPRSELSKCPQLQGNFYFLFGKFGYSTAAYYVIGSVINVAADSLGGVPQTTFDQGVALQITLSDCKDGDPGVVLLGNEVHGIDIIARETKTIRWKIREVALKGLSASIVERFLAAFGGRLALRGGTS